MKLHYFLVFVLSQLVMACGTTGWHGFQAAVSVDIEGLEPELINQVKSDLIGYIKDLGFQEAKPSPHLVEDPEYVKFQHPEYNTVFYNVYLDDPDRIYVTIRDARRSYGSSKDLQNEIGELLRLLKRHVGEDRVEFEQQSTFLS